MADAIQAYVGSFTCPAAGVLTPTVISGITDRNGVAFTPKVVVFFHDGGTPGFIDTPGQPGQFTSFAMGFDDGTKAYSHSVNSQWGFDAPWAGYASSITSSIAQNVAVFAGRFVTRGKITALASGQFTYTLTVNEFGVGRFNFLALGGTSLQYFIGKTSFVSGSQSVTGAGFTPTAGVFTPLVSTTVSGTGNQWGGRAAVGFIDQTRNQVSASASILESASPLTAYRYQRTTRVGVNVDAATALAYDTLNLTSWDADGFTISRAATTSTVNWAYLLLGGVIAQVGSVTQPVANGGLTVTATGIDPVAAMVLTVGGVSSGARQNDARLSLGMFDGSRERGNWFTGLTGGTKTSGGGELWADSTSLLMATPVSDVSSASTVNGRLHLTSFLPELVSGTWSSCDGTQREVLYLILGPAPTPTPAPTIYATRRMRIFNLPFNENKRLFLRRLEIFLEQGQGLSTGQGSDPQIMVSLSSDGGFTWGTERTVSAGKLGEYTKRSILNNLGAYRNGAIKIVVSDPVAWYLVSAFADLEQGSS